MLFKNSQKDWNLKLPDHVNKVILKMSGGADSAILAYLFALYKKEERPDLQLLPATTNGHRPKNWHIKYAKQIVKKITELTNVEFGHHYTNEQTDPEKDFMNLTLEDDYKASTYTQTQQALIRNIRNEFKDGNTIIKFNGVTKNPPRSVSTFYEDYRKGDDRWPADAPFIIERDPNVYHREESGVLVLPPWQRPFANIDKKAIAEYYINYDVLDSLFPLTRSCENEQEKLIDPNNEKHCEKCWWCLERHWAFGRYV